MPNAVMAQTIQLDKALESALAQSWSELMSHSRAELVHIEYQTDHNGSLEFLKVWASNTRGRWDLICEMWLQALWSNPVGLRFANEYHSPSLEHALVVATADENSNSYLPDHHRLIQVYAPKTAEPPETNHTFDANIAVPQPL